MSAVPKKKLCWHCDGNISRDIDNCPFCGVYLRGAGDEEKSDWNPTYDTPHTQEMLHPDDQAKQQGQMSDEDNPQEASFDWMALWSQLKQDVCPILFLMGGSVFFLFGVILLLFSSHGTLTLQWRGSDGVYFLLLSLPFIYFGWKFFQELNTEK